MIYRLLTHSQHGDVTVAHYWRGENEGLTIALLPDGMRFAAAYASPTLVERATADVLRRVTCWQAAATREAAL